MSKKIKGQKLSAAEFFTNTSINVDPNAANVPPPSSYSSGGGFSGFRSQGGPDGASGDVRRTSQVSGTGGGGGGDKYASAFGNSGSRFGAQPASAAAPSWRAARSGPTPTGGSTTQPQVLPPAPPAVQKTTSSTTNATPKAAIEESKPKPTSAANNAKSTLKAEAAKKAQDAKEAQAAKAAKIAEAKARQQEEDAASTEIAKDLLVSGAKGDALVGAINALATKPNGSGLVTAVLAQLTEPLSYKWCSTVEYGAALKKQLSGDTSGQVRALKAIQSHYAKHQFPKVDVKGGQRNLIEVVFQVLYGSDVIDHASFLTWADDDEETTGKLTAIVQTTTFIAFLREEEQGDEDEEEDDDIDVPMATIR